MFALTNPDLINWLKAQPETGMGYWIVSAHLRDGRTIPHVVLDGGEVTKVRGYAKAPFVEADINHFELTHAKWDWR
jgi:hypothetical protein